MKQGFWNTLRLTGFDLFDAKEKAMKQEEKVLDIFIFKKGLMSPYDVWKEMEELGYNYPITSIRRSISNLTDQGLLEKTGDQKMGGYGMKNYCWKLKN